MRTFLLDLIAAGFLAAGAGAAPASAAPGRLLAVMDILNNTGEFAAFVDGMPDMLITELMQSGEVKLVERTKVQTAMKALKLETSGLTQERNQELGKWLGVDGILFGAFNRVGDRYRLDVRAIDVQTGEITAAASAVGDRANVLDIVPEIGRQLRTRLGPGGPAAKPAAPPAPPSQAAPKPAADSCQMTIRYKMIVSLFAEGSVPRQRVRVYLDDVLIGTSGVVGEINRYFDVYQGRVPAGSHTLTLVHGSVDRSGRWVRPLANQPAPFALNTRKGDSPSLRYKLHIYDDSFSFQDFEIEYHNAQLGG